MKTLTMAGLFILALGVIGVASNAVEKNQTQPTDIKGYVVDLSTSNTLCKQGAMEDGSVTDQEATVYCTCVYNRGVSEYGGEQWTNEMKKLGETATMTDQLNKIVNGCITTALGTQVN